MRNRYGREILLRETLAAAGRWCLAALFPEPSRCPLCGARLRGLPEGMGRARLCPGCAGDVRVLAGPLCRVCGRDGHGALCEDCRRAPHDFFTARAHARYEGSVEAAVKAYKYQGDRRLLPVLVDWLVQGYCRHHGADTHMRVTPVPMHPAKFRRRGFNQADDLAVGLCKTLRLTYAPVLERVRAGGSQTAVSRGDRLRAMEGAFAPAPGCDVEGAYILLVDDVLTTGGTADACAAVLFQAGAISVDVLTVAR